MDFEKIFTNNYVILSIKNKMLGTSKKVSDETRNQIAEAAQAQLKRISATKKILEAKELKEIKAAQISLTNWVKNNALPAEEFLRDGCWFIHTDLIPDLEVKHAECCMAIDGQVESLRERWEELKEESRVALGHEWNDGLLPNPEFLDAEFGVEYSLLKLSIPESLSPEVYKKQLEAQNERLKSAYAEVDNTLTEQLKSLLSVFKARCDEYVTGQGRSSSKFHSSLLKNLLDYTKRFERRNLTQNDALSQIVDGVSLWAEEVNLETIKKDENVRKAASAKCEEFINALEAM